MGRGLDTEALGEHDREARLADHLLHLLDQFLVSSKIRLTTRQRDPAVGGQRNPVLRERKVLGLQEQIERVLRDLLKDGHRHPGLAHLRLRTPQLAESLDVPERIFVGRASRVPVIDADGLLEDGVVLATWIDREEERRDVCHVVAAQLI
jgi:hypothetical protein